MLRNMLLLFRLVMMQPNYAGDGPAKLKLVVAHLGAAADRQVAAINCLNAAGAR
jgi:hypothetical protein